MAVKHKSYYKLAHKREDMKNYRWDTIAYDAYKVMIFKIRLARRLKM